MKTFFIAALFLAVRTLVAAAPVLIAVVPKGTTHEYWKAVHAGALRAEQELTAAGQPVQVLWQGPLREDDRTEQVQIVENFAGRQVSAIVPAPLDEHALVAPCEEAVSAGIPVVVIDSRLDSSLPVSLVATDNREGGRLAGRCLGQLLGGQGKVILLRYAVGSGSTEDREAGFLEVMHRDFPRIELVSTDQHAGATRDTAKSASENLLNRYGADVNGIFASNESATAGMLLALRDAGLAGKVKFVGFDAAAALVAGLRAGELQGLIVQDPFRMGYLGVKTAAAAARHEKVAVRVDTGVTLVTPATMNTPRAAALLHPPAP